MSKNPVIHFEMPAKDKSRVAKFYETAFGWKMIHTGPEMGNYVVAQTTETDENNMIKTPGAINGGFFDYANKEGYSSPHVVISVDDIEQSIKDVKSTGGEVMSEIMDIPTIGRYISIKDTEGNIVGVLEPIQ